MASTHVLLVEDDPVHARLVQVFLAEDVSRDYIVESVKTLADALACVETAHFDIIILDLCLPDCRELSTLQVMLAEASAIPILVLSSGNDDALSKEAIRLGALDYLVKDQITGHKLALSIANAMGGKSTLGMKAEDGLIDRFMQCSNNAILAVSVVHDEGSVRWRIELANAICRDMLADGQDAIEGQMLDDVVPLSFYADLDLAFETAFKNGEVRGLHLLYKKLDVVRWVQFDGTRSVVGVAAILTDISAIKAREKELIEAKAAAQKILDEKTGLLNAFCEKVPSALMRIHDRLDVISGGDVSAVNLSVIETNASSARAEVSTLLSEVNGLINQGPMAGFAYIGANYLTVLEMSPDLSAVISAKDGKIMFLNRVGRDILGCLDRGDLSDVSFFDLVPEDYSVLFEDSMMALRIEATRVPMHLVGMHSHLVDVELQVMDCPSLGMDDWKDQDLVLISAVDTTRRNRASRRIIAREEQLRKIMDNVADAIVVVDESGCIETLNRSTETMFGVSSRELVGLGVGRLLGNIADVSGHLRDGLDIFLTGGVPSKISGWRRHTGRKGDNESFPIEIAVRDLNLGERHLFIGLIRDISERVAYEEDIMYMASHDLLTTLANRTKFHEELRHVLDIATKSKARFALMFFDLDHFKSINNSYGHLAGDRVLSAFAKRLVASLGDRARLVSRLSADEFVAIIEDTGGPDELIPIADAVSDAICKSVIVDNHDIRVTCCTGIAEFPDAGPTPEELMRGAEYAVRTAKDVGRSSVQVYDESLSSKFLYRQRLEVALATAVECDQFQVYYQPKICLETNEIKGAEALLRWFHPEIGLVSPVDFIPIAEETGHIREIGTWVLHQVCRDIAEWQLNSCPTVPIAVNLSAIQFRDGNLAISLRDILKTHGISSDLIEVELTESALVEDVDQAVETLKKLKALGLSIAIDDFGSGYSSFGYLTRFPIDCLKIDRSFICDIPFNKDDMTVTRAIIGMAKNLELKIVAEGVETVEQANFLKDQGCDTAQGYFYSRPVPNAAFVKLLRNGLKKLI